jgi:alkylhydroperoxidase family enzyme
MARLPYLDRDDLAPEDQDLLARNINLYRQLVHSPGMARAFQGLGRHIRHGKSALDPRLRELAILQVGWVARAPFEWSHHIKIGAEFGVTDTDVRALIADSEGRESNLPALDRLVLQAARECTAQGRVAPATFDALRAQLGESALMDLVVTLGFYAGVVRVLASLEVDVEPGYRPYLDRFPLPTEAQP